MKAVVDIEKRLCDQKKWKIKIGLVQNPNKFDRYQQLVNPLLHTFVTFIGLRSI